MASVRKAAMGDGFRIAMFYFSTGSNKIGDKNRHFKGSQNLHVLQVSIKLSGEGSKPTERINQTSNCLIKHSLNHLIASSHNHLITWSLNQLVT
jgi:hypothetical protein